MIATRYADGRILCECCEQSLTTLPDGSIDLIADDLMERGEQVPESEMPIVCDNCDRIVFSFAQLRVGGVDRLLEAAGWKG